METPLRRILLVDDDAAWRRAVALLLAGRYAVVQTGSCEEALEHLEREVAALDLVLLDLDLGDDKLRGDVVLPVLARRWPELPVVVLTGNDSAQEAVDLLRLGAADYIVKLQCKGTVLAEKLDGILRDVALSREIQVLRVLLETRLAARATPTPEAPAGALPAFVIRPLDELNRDYCTLVLRVCGGNVHEAARRLAVPYSSLRAYMLRWRAAAPGAATPPAGT